jgi:hypothetical protein
MRVLTSMRRGKEKVNSNGLMGNIMLENGKMGIGMGREFGQISKEIVIVELG